MYYFQVESYMKTIETCDKFCVELTYVDGSKIRSSGLPMTAYAYNDLLESIVSLYEVKTPWSMWDKEHQKVIIVPYEQIRSVDIIFLD